MKAYGSEKAMPGVLQHPNITHKKAPVSCTPTLLFYCLALVFLVFYSSFRLEARTEPSSTAHILILDASRSMSGKFQTDAKYLAVQTLLPDVIANLDATARIGLMTFGAKRRSSCQDISYPVKLGPPDDAAVRRALKEYKPRGKAPISLALTRAAKELNAAKQTGTITLVVDGYDTCRRGPCSSAKTLKKRSNALTINVIGLALDAKNEKNFQCITEATDGVLINTTSPQDLKDALLKVLGLPDAQFQTRLEKFFAYRKAKQEEEQLKKLLTGPSRMQLQAVLKTGGTPVQDNISWTVYKEKIAGPSIVTPLSANDIVARSSDTTPLFSLDPGTYIVEAMYGDLVKARQAITLPEKGTHLYTLNLNAGRLQLRTSKVTAGPDLDGVFYSLFKAIPTASSKSAPLARSSLTRPVFDLPAGDYIVIARYGALKLEQPVTITAGENIDLRLAYNIGTLELSSIASQNASQLSQVVYNIYPPYDTNLNNRTRQPLATSALDRPSFSLPEGQYLVVAEHKHLRQRQTVNVVARQTTQDIINFNTGTITLQSILSADPSIHLKKNISYTIHRVLDVHQTGQGSGETQELKEVVKRNDATANFLLKPGKYLVRGQYGQINAEVETEVTVIAGAAEVVTLRYEAGKVRLSLIDEGRNFPAQNVFWKIYTQDAIEDIVWNSSRPTPELILAANTYKAVAEYKDKQYEQSFEVVPGGDISVQIQAQTQNIIR